MQEPTTDYYSNIQNLDFSCIPKSRWNQPVLKDITNQTSSKNPSLTVLDIETFLNDDFNIAPNDDPLHDQINYLFSEPIDDECKNYLDVFDSNYKENEHVSGSGIQFPDHPTLACEPAVIKNSVQPDQEEECVPNQHSIQNHDIYTPNLIRYSGSKREGLCSTCKKWFQLKNSAYW